MCTVTFIPSNGSFYLTSNRDEKAVRKKALLPEQYDHGSGRLLFPKDLQGGGTWICANSNRDAAALLNGGFLPHPSLPPYRQSRGLVLLDILQDNDPPNCMKHYDCIGIEPFTAVFFLDKKLYECRWNGKDKYLHELSIQKAYIWSSVTLYSKEVIAKREKWFKQWRAINLKPTQEDILNFHRFSGDGDISNDLVMNRNGITVTVSITSIAVSEEEISMVYRDAVDDKVFNTILESLDHTSIMTGT